jgi:hypothetical protein
MHAYAPRIAAQWQATTGPSGAALGAVVGGDVERYVRALAVGGIIATTPWATRPYGAEDLRAMLTAKEAKSHPWQPALARAVARPATLGGAIFTSFNSGFPWGNNDGAMWQGRGVNAAIGGAATIRWKHGTLVAAPSAFVAQNSSFPQLLQSASSVSRYADPLFPGNIDLPQRMGGSAYVRLDPGESSLRMYAGSYVAGVSTASIGWGTGESFPAVLGPNAGGFPHIFAGTRGRGARIPRLGHVSAEYVLGVLQQTAWSPVQGSESYVSAQQSGTRRIGTGLNVSLTPELLPNLELGASRFFHSPYRSGPRRWDAWSKPFEGLFKANFGARNPDTADPTGDADNQLASVYARWVFPVRGVEANIELFREDHNWDSRDLAQEPENNGAVLASIRTITHRRATQLGVLTFEYFDGDVRPIAQARAQGYLYISGGLLQGHTQRGQLLGTPIGPGAVAGERVGWERFTSDGALRVNLQRWRTRSLRTPDGQGLYLGAGNAIPYSHDWIVDGCAAITRYHGNGARTIEAGIAWAGQFNFDIGRVNLYARASWSVF